EKAGIIGINGTGKSTLLKMIAGIDSPDSGEIIIANKLTVRYLPQTPVFHDNDNVLQAIIKDLVTEENRWTIESDAKTMLNRLGITDYDELCGHLSGGQRKRLALVSALLTKADLLLLDEPTNHLDSQMSGWLEEQLKGYRGSVIMITHDRYFLDSVTDRIIEVDKGKIYSYKENYSGYLELKSEREQIADATERKRQSILRTELAWVRRGARARSTKQKARLERFEEMSAMKAPVKDDNVVLDSVSSRLGKTTIEINGVSKSYGNKKIIDNFSYNFLRNDRIGIIGKNGCGKSTLLKLIMGIERPDSGEIIQGTTVKTGYFAQEVVLGKDMDPNERVIDYIRDEAWYVDTPDGKLSATALLERFLFKGEDQYGLIGKLSGGERRRLYLCRVLMSAPNVLILDEPTNDLDVTTLTILEDYLDRFDGIVIVVSHDRYFLDRVTRRIFAFEENNRIVQSEGGYTDYEFRRQMAEKTQMPKKDENKTISKQGCKPRNNQKLKLSYNEQKEYDTIEADISKLEEQLEEIDVEMTGASSDFVKLSELSKEKERLSGELDNKMERWMYLEELVAQIQEQK
ncbi:MAG: ABC-F family ATP-binding cassette domain-containing protein, partial [Wujia sp.]